MLRKVIIYGAGYGGLMLVDTLQAMKTYDIVCLMNKDNDKIGRKYNNIPIVSPEIFIG